MVFRRAHFLSIGGCDPGMSVVEEADLCVRIAQFGRIKLVNCIILTSDRRVAASGEWKANWIYFTVGIRWAMELFARLGERSPHIR